MKTTDAQRKEICKKVKRALTVFNMRMKRINADFEKQTAAESDIKETLKSAGKPGLIIAFKRSMANSYDSLQTKCFRREKQYALSMLQCDVESAFGGKPK